MSSTVVRRSPCADDLQGRIQKLELRIVLSRDAMHALLHRPAGTIPPCRYGVKRIECCLQAAGAYQSPYHYRLCAIGRARKGLARDMRVRWALEEVGQLTKFAFCRSVK